jgi:hypothetical protein
LRDGAAVSNKPVYYFEVATGEIDEHGEIAFTWIGGRLIPDGLDMVWLTKPDGQKVFRVPKSKVSPSSKTQLAEAMLREIKLKNS